jgi:hypothetical protein
MPVLRAVQKLLKPEASFSPGTPGPSNWVARSQPLAQVFSVSGPKLLLVEYACNRPFDDTIHNDYTTVVQPNQMCRTPPNQVPDHAVISIAHPGIRRRYGGAHSANEFVRIGLGKRLPIWLPVEAIEFYTRQFKCGSDARSHRCLACTEVPITTTRICLWLLRANENIQVGAEDSTSPPGPAPDGKIGASRSASSGISGPAGGTTALRLEHLRKTPDHTSRRSSGYQQRRALSPLLVSLLTAICFIGAAEATDALNAHLFAIHLI